MVCAASMGWRWAKAASRSLLRVTLPSHECRQPLPKVEAMKLRPLS